MALLRRGLTTLLLLWSGCLGAEPALHFLSVSDIHFNPFASCHWLALKPCPLIAALRDAPVASWNSLFEQYDSPVAASYTHDSNYALLKSTLNELHTVAIETQPQFTLVLGDFLGHHFHEEYLFYTHDRSKAGYQAFVKKTLQFLAADIRHAIPQGDIYPAVGNNDSYSGDYHVVPNGDFLRDTANTWATLILQPDNQQQLRNWFPRGGYYAVTLPGNKQQHLLVLNTVLFSSAANSKAMEAEARAQLRWLQQQLASAAAAKQKVWLAFHIPVGVNVYQTVMHLLGGIKEFWRADYSDEFDHIVRHYPGTVRAMLPGHIHMDSFQVIGLNQLAETPVSFTPSISPIFGNNPAFKVYSYDPVKLQLINYDTYYFNLADAPSTWHWQKEYTFTQVYRTCLACDVVEGMKQITQLNTMATSYKQFYAVSTHSQLITQDHNWESYYWCDIFSVTARAYKACLTQ